MAPKQKRFAAIAVIDAALAGLFASLLVAFGFACAGISFGQSIEQRASIEIGAKDPGR